MKKVMLTLAVIALLASSAALAQGYNQKGKVLNVGAGFGFGVEGDATLPPLSVGLQFGLTDKISVGGIVGYAGSKYELALLGKPYEWKYSYIIIGARGEYHFMEPNNKLDAYAGATVGYNVVSVTEPSNLGLGVSYSAASSELLIGFHVGARYAIDKNWGVFGELGYGIGYVTAGAFFRL
ncbi:MAG: outer membrane beta-barrel protein [Bacteroidota bacterium]